MSTEDQRQRWKAHWQEFHELSSAWQEQGCSGQAPTYPELPDDLVGLNCGAVTRAGTPCKQKAIYGNGRCKFHGGLATGPTTDAGKEQCRINGRKGGRPRKDAAEKTQVIEPQGICKVLASTQISDAKVLQRIQDSQATASSAAETEIMETDKAIVSEALPGKDSVRVVTAELQELVRPESSPEKPKSWESRKVVVSAICERCTMFASNGACLAVAKGRISSMPTDGNCAAFSAF